LKGDDKKDKKPHLKGDDKKVAKKKVVLKKVDKKGKK